MPTPAKKTTTKTKARRARPRKDNGTRAKVVPRFRKNMRKNILTDYRFANDVRGQDIADAAGVPVTIVHALEHGDRKGASRGKVPSNHPGVPALANAYGMAVADLAPFLGPPSVYWGGNAPTPDTIAPGVRIVVRKDAPTAKVVKKKDKRATPNTLTRTPLSVREFVRGLVTDVNVRIMEGVTEIILPPMPIAIVRGMLADYLKAKNVTAPLLLDPDFPTHFG